MKAGSRATAAVHSSGAVFANAELLQKFSHFTIGSASEGSGRILKFIRRLT